MALRQINEGLRNYLYGPLQPTNVGPSTTPSPRLPVGPDSAIPQGVRPIPTSSQQNKKTNVQIPYARMALAPIPEGEIVVIEHAPHYMKRKSGTAHHEAQPTVQVLTLEQANADLKAAALHGAAGAPLPLDLRHWLAGDGASADAGLGRYRLDGVVNNSEHEAMLAPPYTGDYGTSLCQVNVAVQGHVRLLNDDARRCDMAKTHCGSVVYVGIWQRFTFRPLTPDEEARYRASDLDAVAVLTSVREDPRSTMHYRFERFSSTMLTAGKYRLGTPANGGDHAVLHDNYECCSLDDVVFGSLFAPADWASTNAYPGVAQSDAGNRYVPDLIRSFGTSRTAGPFGFERLIGAYVLGMTADSNQSPNMLTVVVNVGFRDWIGYEEVDRLRATYNAQDVVSLVPPGGGDPWAVLLLPAHWQGWRPPALLNTAADALHTPPESVPLADTAAARAVVDAELAAGCAKRSWRPTTVDDLIFKGHGPVARLLHSQWVAPDAAAWRDRQ